MLNIAMIGGTYEPEVLTEMAMKYRYGVDVPACVLQWKMIEGLTQDTEVKLNLINERRIPTYPTAKVIFANREKWNCINVENAAQFSFINLPFLKRVSKVWGITRELKEWYKKDCPGEKVVLVYALHTPYLIASSMFIKWNNIKQFLIVPDLPQYMNSSSMTPLKRVLKRIDGALHKWLLEFVDGFFLLSKYIADAYSIEATKYAVLEGIADTENGTTAEIIHKRKAILYTGALSERYGLITLLEAYEKCDDIGELWICGEGDARDKVEAACEKNKNIKYFGQLPRKEVLRKQQEASLLVNPRNSNDEYTKFSFPSKTMEYLQSGTPVLMSRLKGVPEEYEPFIYWINDESVDGWAIEVKNIMSLSEAERDALGKNARRFVLEKKNSIAQARIITTLIKNKVEEIFC